MKRLAAVVVMMVVATMVFAESPRLDPDVARETDEFTGETSISASWGVMVDGDTVIVRAVTTGGTVSFTTGVFSEDLHSTETLRWIIDEERYSFDIVTYEFELRDNSEFASYAVFDITPLVDTLLDASDVRWRLDGAHNIEDTMTDAELEALREVLHAAKE